MASLAHTLAASPCRAVPCSREAGRSRGVLHALRWINAAAALVPLARGKAAASYELPAEFGPHAGKLPGPINGMDRVLSPEPECEPIACTM